MLNPQPSLLRAKLISLGNFVEVGRSSDTLPSLWNLHCTLLRSSLQVLVQIRSYIITYIADDRINSLQRGYSIVLGDPLGVSQGLYTTRRALWLGA